tara:strand:- start:23 stop:559 length:537 start_codon:yes stop_codon:yes gene_type:complete
MPFARLKRIFCRRKKKKPAPAGKLDPRSKANLENMASGAMSVLVDLTLLGKKTAASYGLEIKVISGRRTYQEQAELYAQGRTKEGKVVTYARPGYSRHNFGTALDFGIFRDGEYLDAKQPVLVTSVYRSIYNNAKNEGLPIIWGGNWTRFPDPPHFEYDNGLTMAQMRELKSKGAPVT